MVKQLPTTTLSDTEDRQALAYFACPESSGIMTAAHNSLPLPTLPKQRSEKYVYRRGDLLNRSLLFAHIPSSA